MDKPEKWTISHFSLANPEGPGRDDVPALLRRIADNIEAHGKVDIQDLVLHRDIGEDGQNWPSITVYFHTNFE